MSEPTRTPGRVNEETAPVDGSTSTTDSDHLRSKDIPRAPGPVEGPTEAMPDEQVSAQSEEIIDAGLNERSLWGLVFWVLSINVFIWLFYEVTLGVIGAWHQSPWIGLLLAAMTCILLVVLVLAGRREYKAFKAIDTLADRHAQMHTALASDNLTALRDALEPTLNNLRQGYSSRVAEFEEAAKNRETASDYLEQFENMVLIQLDNEANAAIKRSALLGGSVVAIVPHPALDAAVALWRATALIRKIGQIYGLEPTGLSSLRLLKHSIATAIIAAGTDVAVDLAAEQVGLEMADQVSSNLGKGAAGGVVTAWRLFRLGNYAQKLCRPVTS